MTRLFIDGQEVVLPEQFELEFITENPYFTRCGEYTYDIDIDLRSPVNRQIYKNIDRSDVTKQISNRKAVLISGSYKIIVGVEVVLSIDDHIAKIQIVAGNSQLNYDGNTKIRDFDFDDVTYSRQEASNSLLDTYPAYKAVCTPVIFLETGSDYTRSLNDLQIKDGMPDIKEDAEIVPQYYLAYVVENLLAKLGFKRGSVDIENNELWKRLFIVNSQNNNRLADILPDWTINEFFEQIEMFFNCVIQIDKANMTYSILNMNEYFEDASPIYIDNVIDEGSGKVYNKDTNYAYTYEYVSYDIPSDNYYNYMRLKDGVYVSCLHATFDDISGIDTSNYDKWYKTPHIISTSNNNLCYIVTKEKMGSQLVEKYVLKIVDIFKDSGNKDSENKTILKIVPEKTGRKNIWIFADTWYFCNAVKQIREFNYEKEDINIDDLVNGKAELKEYIPDRIYAGIYYGLQKTLKFDVHGNPLGYTNNKFPFSGVDNYAVLWQVPEKPAVLELPFYTMALDGEKGLFEQMYRNKRSIDTSVEYNFRFLTNKVYDLNSIFIICNKRYYCKEIRYKITPDGMDNIAEGAFYLAK